MWVHFPELLSGNVDKIESAVFFLMITQNEKKGLFCLKIVIFYV